MEKKQVTAVEFNKRVEIEAANLMYFEYMKPEKAFVEAKAYIETKYVAVK